MRYQAKFQLFQFFKFIYDIFNIFYAVNQIALISKNYTCLFFKCIFINDSKHEITREIMNKNCKIKPFFLRKTNEVIILHFLNMPSF